MSDITEKRSKNNNAIATDSLVLMLEKQRELSKTLGGGNGISDYPKDGPVEKRLHALCTAIIHETIELDRHTNWKWWKKTEALNEAEAREELIDILHFVLQGAIELEMTPEQVRDEYLKKAEVNLQRQRDGYRG